MKQPFPPSMLAMDNEMEKFWQEYKRNQGLPVSSPSGEQRVTAVEGSPSVRLDGSGLVLPEAAAPTGELIKGSLARASHTSGPNGHRPDRGDSLWSSSHIAAETEADRQFIASAKLLAALPKKQKRFSWAGVIGFLVVAVIVGGLTYLFVEGW